MLLLVLVLATTSCSSGKGSEAQEEEAQRQRDEANAAYLGVLTSQIAFATWPAGYTPVVNRIYQRTTLDDVLITDPDRHAAVMVKQFQYCAWIFAWLDASASGATEPAATAMEILLDPDLYAEVDPGSREHLLGLARSAQLGDPTGLQSIVDQNCLPDDWLERS
jgi:hypothetical protein